MGEVYRARDTKLGREVAIKVLLEEVSTDPERRARFEREARALASLNHTNVATLHGFESEGDTSYLVMELVEGETLADRIARGPIPIEEAIPLFLQIAEGLEGAHAKGVVHRDLKPANIKVSRDGQTRRDHVKILDFGLATAMAGPGFSQAGLRQRQATEHVMRNLVWVDRQGREEPLSTPPKTYQRPRISPDGRRVALEVETLEGAEEGTGIWIWDLTRKTLTLLPGDETDGQPLWAPASTTSPPTASDSS